MTTILEDTLISYLFDLDEDANLMSNEDNQNLSRQGLMEILRKDLTTLEGIDDLYEGTKTTLTSLAQCNDSEYEELKLLLIREGELPADWLAKKGVSPA